MYFVFLSRFEGIWVEISAKIARENDTGTQNTENESKFILYPVATRYEANISLFTHINPINHYVTQC